MLYTIDWCINHTPLTADVNDEIDITSLMPAVPVEADFE